MSLREKQAEARRRQMLSAAENLIRTTGSTEFSMRALAAASEVSETTPYNFFGTKEGLLFELLTEHMADFMGEANTLHSPDPIEQVLVAGDKAVRIFLRDPVLMRPLYHVVFGVTDPMHHPQFLARAFQFYNTTLDALDSKGLIGDKQDRIILASSLMAHFMGVLDLWIHEDIDDHWFVSQVVYGFAHMLWPFASGKSLATLKDHMQRAKQTLSNARMYPSFVPGGKKTAAQNRPQGTPRNQSPSPTPKRSKKT